MTDEVQEETKQDPFPWFEFLDVRARLIVHFRSEGKSWEEVAGVLSCEPTQVQLIHMSCTSKKEPTP